MRVEHKTQDAKLSWFYDYIKSYRYFNEVGFLDLESFCVILSRCFGADGILHLSPQPNDVYALLVSMLAEKAEDEKRLKLWVQRVPVSDWTPDMDFIYPEKMVTFIHPAGLIGVFHDWIADIGYGLMEIPFPDEEPPRYYGWAKPEWTFVHAFLDGFHESFFSFLKEFDKQRASEGCVSLFETFHLSLTKPNLSFDDAALTITSRNQARREAMARMEAAIEAGFFLEAIALEEAVISNCIYLYCQAKGILAKETSLYAMLEAARRHVGNAHKGLGMFEEVDRWRRDRNHAMHNFVTARSEDLLQSRDVFASRSEETARRGVALAEVVCSWYEREAPFFMTTSWPKPPMH